MAGFFTLRWNQGHLDFIDQTRLPFEERIVSTNDVHVVAEAILSLLESGEAELSLVPRRG